MSHNDTDLIDAGPRQLRAAEQLPADLMLLKMENESIMQIAKVQPREPMVIVAQLRELIEAWPAAAEEAIYSKPVGSVTEVQCGEQRCGIRYEVSKVDQNTVCPACGSKRRGDCRKITKYAEGLSIRAAESIRSIYGYTRLTTTCEILANGNAKLTGVIVDYAAGNMTSDERVVPRQYKSKEGPMVTVPEDRFMGVVVKAEKSKLIRDIVLSNTPGIIKAMYRDMCETKLEGLVAPEIIEQKIIPAFAKYGIGPEVLDRIVGKPAKLGWSEQERLNVRKILTALKNEETTVTELMAGLLDKQETVQPLPTAKPAPQTTTELAEQLKAKQAAAAGQSGETAEPAKTAEPTAESPKPTFDSAAVIADATLEFNACDAIGMVTKCAAEWNAKYPALRSQFSQLADQARDRIRESKAH